MLTYVILLLLSILFSAGSILLFIRIFYKLDILDNPKKYWKNRKPIPYGMGIIFFVVFFIVSYFLVEPNYKLYLIWFFGFIITVVSFMDDLLNISAKMRLIIQIIIGATIGITSIKIWYISNIFWWVIDLDTHFFMILGIQIYIIPLIFTILWYVFIFNALNWSDGIQGNTSGLSLISFSILFFLGMKLYFLDDYEGGVKNAEFIMSLSVILVWILIPFWFFDIREKILMGDSGTMFLGFMLASLAIISWWKIATVLVVFWIYSVDAVYVLIKRLWKGKNLLTGDLSHIHHRALKAWLSKWQVLLVIYFLSFSFWITALFLDKTWKIIVFVIIIFVVVFLNKILEKIKNN